MICGVEFIKRGFKHSKDQDLRDRGIFLEIYGASEVVPFIYRVTGIQDSKVNLEDKDGAYRNLSIHSALTVKRIRLERRLLGIQTFIIMRGRSDDRT